MIRGIHYFSAEIKTKIDIIPRGCFSNKYRLVGLSIVANVIEQIRLKYIIKLLRSVLHLFIINSNY